MERRSRGSRSSEGWSWAESLHRRTVVREGRVGLRRFAAVCESCAEGEEERDLEFRWCDALGWGRGTVQRRSEREELFADDESCVDGYLYLEEDVTRARFGWVSRRRRRSYLYTITVCLDPSLPVMTQFQRPIEQSRLFNFSLTFLASWNNVSSFL